MAEPHLNISIKDRLHSSKNMAARSSGRSAKELAQDDIVMATNSSSIVSKRSVEKIYYPHEPQFLRHFVKKSQRRSPLINRGYHIRMNIIEKAVRGFLGRPSGKTKVVVNLGCGSDVLPWQCWTRDPKSCEGAKFVDIDFPDLMKHKAKIVQNTPELKAPLLGAVWPENGQVFLTSDRYFQIGCDLRDLNKLEASLSSILDLPNCTFIFIAEVSVTYMETERADAVINWTSSLGEAEFCLLEQILPDGPNHPFSETMLKHFNNLNAPPKSAFAYPSIWAQKDRFRRLGWLHINAQSLWQIWSDSEYFTADERKQLNAVEPFDEWEEFALYAGHYVVVFAGTIRPSQTVSTSDNNGLASAAVTILPEPQTRFHVYKGSRGQRRFGAALKTTQSAGESTISNIFGLGTTTRLKSQDNYDRHYSLEEVDIPSKGPSSRMCHAVVNLGSSGNMLCGGRLSPSRALKDTWLLGLHSSNWFQLNDLPVPLYRHSMTSLGTSHNIALVVGGKTDSSSIFPGCLIFRNSQWIECRIRGDYTPVFGAVLLSLPYVKEVTRDLRFTGILMGGMLEDGTVAKQCLSWTMEIPSDDRVPTIFFVPLAFEIETTVPVSMALIHRFGASGVVLNDHDIIIIGGIIAEEILTPAQEIVRVRLDSNPQGSSATVRLVSSVTLAKSDADVTIPRPLLVGISATLEDTGKLVIMGGGAVCFSMGSFWNTGCYTIDMNDA